MPCPSYLLERSSPPTKHNIPYPHPQKALDSNKPLGEGTKMMTVETEPVSPDWVGDQLSLGTDILLLDCRPPNEYNTSHIAGAIHVAIPTLMMKRLKKGNLSLDSVIKCQKFLNNWRTDTLVVYDNDTSDLSSSPTCLLALLFKRLVEDGCNVHILNGGFDVFQTNFPQFCMGMKDAEESTIFGLRNLQITESQSSDEVDPPSPTSSSPFPVEVLPHLFLGNAKNSADLGCLYKNGIKYILNVTPNIPNTFENDNEFRYMQIPINDHWSQNLSAFFPDAIAFIDEARDKSCGVLVHCLAGISRSVTVTVAYLMFRSQLTLNDAYDVVKKCKPNISPNFNFMGQLLDFERTMCSSGTIRCGCRGGSGLKSPDDGVDGELNGQAGNNELRVCHCRKETKTFFSSPTCASSSVSSTSSMSSSSSLAMSSASSNTAFDYDVVLEEEDIPPTPS